MANQTKRTPANRQRILDLLALGTTRKAAYSAVMMSHETFADWLNEDDDFREAVEAAQQQAITRKVALLEKAAQPRQVKKTRTEFHKGKKIAQTVEEYVDEGDWRAAAWLLERMDPESFGKKVDVTSNGQQIKAYAGFDLDEV